MSCSRSLYVHLLRGLGAVALLVLGFVYANAIAWLPVLLIGAVVLLRGCPMCWTGGVGGEESFLDPDPKDGSIDEVMRATRDGELFLFVNDAVIGVPGLVGVFYSNNVGNAQVTVNLGRLSRQQRREPGPLPGAMDLGVADDRECSGHEQAT